MPPVSATAKFTPVIAQRLRLERASKAELDERCALIRKCGFELRETARRIAESYDQRE